MIKGITRGLLLGLILLAVDLVYVFLRYRPDGWDAWRLAISNSIFLLALCVLIGGVTVFSRLFSFRRRMYLPNVNPLERQPHTREEKQELEHEKAKMNEEDKVSLNERGRDITLLVTAAMLVLVSILLSL
ncbi:hypothetical protein OS242_05750 [Tumebacillus sp. DT12]|uniref:DUF3899 domain-containing protein n=1 Tax=Tumebacillus lacus TaxID=2995335 RepID=A0ABT3WXQ3_9BACL|nr:hypothetical protein [Tumebacillus lacus]MCX7569458.1 hypothetical protein [Tumebacillus lacus]